VWDVHVASFRSSLPDNKTVQLSAKLVSKWLMCSTTHREQMIGSESIPIWSNTPLNSWMLNSAL
jgi:hypothetical protein